MAGSKSDYFEKKVLDMTLGGTAFTPPATVYIALFTDSNSAAQRDAGTVTEVSGPGYSRVAVTNNSTNWPAATGTTSTKVNGTDIIFPTATGSWGTVNAYGIYDASVAGNLLYWGDMTTPQSVVAGNIVKFPANTGITITED